MKWIGEGPHLSLLETLLELGVDPADAGVQLFPSWPRPCDPNWQAPYMIPDPFYIEAVAMLAKADPGTPHSTKICLNLLF